MKMGKKHHTNTQLHTQIHKYTNTQIHKYNTQIHKYTNKNGKGGCQEENEEFWRQVN